MLNGRSQRTEVLLFVCGLMVISAGIRLLAGLTTTSGYAHLVAWPVGHYVRLGLDLLMVPLLVRRLHDFNSSGWFALILPAAIGLHAWGQIQYDIGLLPTPELNHPYNALHVGLVFAIWVISLWPGTKGPNRFGPDPRVEESPAES